MTVGISGSGKSKFIQDKLLHNDLKICPDDIRREITGEVTNNSEDRLVWSLAIDRTLENLIRYGYSIFDATFVNSKTFLRTTNKLLSYVDGLVVQIILYVFTPDVELSTQRIHKDIENNVDRYKVLDHVIIEQSKKLRNWIVRIYEDQNLKIRDKLVFKFIDSKTHAELTEKEFYTFL